MQIFYWFVIIVLSFALFGWLYCAVGVVLDWEKEKQKLKDKGWWIL